MSQQLRSLEEQIGTTLVTRAGRKVRLTEAGERYFELIAEHVDAIIRSTDHMRGVKAPRMITIRATPTIASKWLLPRLGRFLEREPGTEVRLDGSNEPTDFTRDAVDLEIRHGAGGWSGLHVEPLVEESFLPICAPGQAGPGSLDAEALVSGRLIRSIKAQVQWSDWFAAAGLGQVRPDFRLSFDRSHMAIEAAALGFGIALESDLMISDDLAAGKLVIPVSRPPELRIATQWIVCPHTSLRRGRVQRLVEWLREEAAEWQPPLPRYFS